MIIETIKGDLLKFFEEGKFSTIAHGCNCFTTMSSGIAGQIVKKYPMVAEADRKFHIRSGSPLRLGQIDIVDVDDSDRAILNMYTQFDYGTDSRKVEYAAIWSCFDQLVRECNDFPLVAIPQIGAGLAGGDWNLIKEVINDATAGYVDVVVVEYQP